MSAQTLPHDTDAGAGDDVASPAFTATAAAPTPAAYRKFFVHLAASVLGLLLAAREGGISPVEGGQLILLVAGSALVYNARNGNGLITGYAKAVLAWTVTLATAVIPTLSGGWTDLADNIPVILAAAVGALGVGVVPNAGTSNLADSVRDVLGQLHALHGKVDRVEAVQVAVQATAAAVRHVPTERDVPQRQDTGRSLIVPTATTSLSGSSSNGRATTITVHNTSPVPASSGAQPDELTTSQLTAVSERVAPFRLGG